MLKEFSIVLFGGRKGKGKSIERRLWGSLGIVMMDNYDQTTLYKCTEF